MAEGAMADEGGLPGLIFRLSILLLLLGLASLQLQAWTSRETAPSRRVKQKNIVEGEPAGQGIPDRVQCEDSSVNNGSSRKLKARLLRDRPCLFLEKETVSFVTLFVLPEAETNEATTMKTTKMHAVLRAFLESIQVSMPNTTRAMIITKDSKFREELPQNAEWRLSPRQFERENLMVQRLESYIDILEDMMKKRRSSITHVIFSDFDMIVVNDLGCVFHKYPFFDIALTFRNNRRQPINSGVIMVRGTLTVNFSHCILDAFDSYFEPLQILRSHRHITDKKKRSFPHFQAKAMLEEVVRIYRFKFRCAFGLLGDQLALADVIKASSYSREFGQGDAFEALVMATRTLSLPCAIYNWSPSEGAGQFHGMPTEVQILHFRGSRKRLMLHAWSVYKQQDVEDFSNMMCLVLKSGRSKYDY